jgi:hypothetical protein
LFTDQELLTIWFFAHFEGYFEKKRRRKHRFKERARCARLMRS